MTADSTWKTATYTELIGAKEVIFSDASGGVQVRILNMGDGTNCMSRITFITPDNAYNTCYEFSVNFTTGVVKHRQQKASSGSYATYKICMYR